MLATVDRTSSRIRLRASTAELELPKYDALRRNPLDAEVGESSILEAPKLENNATMANAVRVPGSLPINALLEAFQPARLTPE